MQEPADLSALSGCAPDLARAFVSLASDIAVIIDDNGVVTEVAQDPRAPIAPLAQLWVGKPWVDSVTGDTRRKIEMLLADVVETGVGRRREVNHAGTAGDDIPVAYTALRLGEHGPVLAVGRDLRTVAAIQQRFLDTQQELERSYWLARQVESRYRLLFQVATDAVLTVDGPLLRIVDANPTAGMLLQAEPGPLAGRVAEQLFEARSRPAVRELLSKARSTGRPAEIQVRLAGTHATVGLSATPFRTDQGLRLLVRLRATEPSAGDPMALGTPLSRRVDGILLGVVVTDSSGKVVVANRAFAQMVQGPGDDPLRGRSLAEWLGCDASSNADQTDLHGLIARVREHGIAELSPALLRRAGADALPVDVAATLLTEGDQECLGFTLRLRPPGPASVLGTLAGDLARAIDALAVGLGNTALPTLMQRAEQLARAHLVRKALERAGGDPARAAALLGVDEATLVELRREQLSPAADFPS